MGWCFPFVMITLEAVLQSSWYRSASNFFWRARLLRILTRRGAEDVIREIHAVEAFGLRLRDSAVRLLLGRHGVTVAVLRSTVHLAHIPCPRYTDNADNDPTVPIRPIRRRLRLV